MITECDLVWLAGYLEGEGSFMRGSPSQPNLPVIQVMATDEDVILRVANMFGTACQKIKSRSQKWKQAYSTRLRGKKAVNFMMSLKPLMGKRRQQQIEKALASYNAKSYKLTEDIVKQIKIALQQGKKQGVVAKEFGLRRETVNKINCGKFWSDVIV